MIRLFPYSFNAIEFQGDGFDSPDRLFYSIPSMYKNIASLKSDLRELIPEFYYFPEMFLNINKINFSRKSDNKLVDNVLLPYDVMQSEMNHIDEYVSTIQEMKTKLELNKQNLGDWVEIIFGVKQKYSDSNEGQLFRSESYIGYGEKNYSDFNKYLKMQSIAEVRLRPRFGDTSLNLENYIKKVGVIRKQIMDNLMQELNNTENRYNDERPEVDSKFRTKSKVLADNSWKNSFSLEEYQKFFSKSLKGKISSMNYRLMLKRFRQISNMCFAEGNLNVASIRKMDSGDY